MRAWRVAGVVLAIGILFGGPFLLIQFLKSNLDLLNGTTGYLVAAAVGVVTNATILLPTPTFMPLVVTIAKENGIWLVVLVYAAASAVGESVAYFSGRIVNEIPKVEQSGLHRFLERCMQGRWRTSFILTGLAAIPSPYDVGGIVAGNARYPFTWFWGATFAGRCVKYLYYIPLWEEIESLVSRVSWLDQVAPLLMMFFVLVVVAIPNRKTLWGMFQRFTRSPQAE